MQQDQPKKQSFLKGCLIVLAIFGVLAIIGGFLLFNSLGKVVQEATQEVAAEVKKAEDELARKPESEFQSISLENLLKTAKQYEGKYLQISGLVNSSGALAQSKIPLKLPGDLLILQPTTGKDFDKHSLLGCIYSETHKTEFAALKEQQSIELRGKLELDEDGDLSLMPCLLVP